MYFLEEKEEKYLKAFFKVKVGVRRRLVSIMLAAIMVISSSGMYVVGASAETSSDRMKSDRSKLPELSGENELKGSYNEGEGV